MVDLLLGLELNKRLVSTSKWQSSVLVDMSHDRILPFDWSDTHSLSVILSSARAGESQRLLEEDDSVTIALSLRFSWWSVAALLTAECSVQYKWLQLQSKQYSTVKHSPKWWHNLSYRVSAFITMVTCTLPSKAFLNIWCSDSVARGSFHMPKLPSVLFMPAR